MPAELRQQPRLSTWYTEHVPWAGRISGYYRFVTFLDSPILIPAVVGELFPLMPVYKVGRNLTGDFWFVRDAQVHRARTWKTILKRVVEYEMGRRLKQP